MGVCPSQTGATTALFSSLSLSAARYHKHPSLRVDVLRSDQTKSIFLIEEPTLLRALSCLARIVRILKLHIK